MKILLVDDVPEWGIGALTKSIERHAKHRFNITVVHVHPRSPDGEAIKLRTYIQSQGNFDLWVAMYWNSGSRLLDLVPELRDVPGIVSHQNHYALEKEKWDRYQKIVIPTKWGEDFLKDKYYGKVERIPYGIDLDRFSFIEDRIDDGKTIGYVGRVIEHKHLGEITLAAKKLGYRVLGTGYVDKPEYWQTVDKEALDFHGGVGRQNMNDAAIKDRLYEKMTVFVMYSTGEKETGTLPLLEAMARGVPVMSTSQGMARDLIEDGKNGIIFTEENFEEKLDMLMKNRELQEKLRQEGWKTIRNYPEERMSLDNQKLWASMLANGKKTISIVIPTKNRPEQLMDSLVAIEAQQYPYAEVLVCDDGLTTETAQVVKAAKAQMRTPVIHLRTSARPYGLSEARNLGIIEALGEIVVFLDDRLKLRPGALNSIAACAMKPKVFYHGAKWAAGFKSTKLGFIENFSWCLRRDIIEGGMFPEWLRSYGGISQEVRHRLSSQGWSFEYYSEAESEAMVGVPKNKERSQVWKSKNLLRKIYG